jgi:phospholipase/lecithinase/hemolysin
MRVTPLSKSLPVCATVHAARRPRIAATLFFVLLFTFGAVAGYAQNAAQALNYTSIVVFGDSLSDTGNVANLTQAKYGFRVPGVAADYTDGRFTDGADTLPPAEKYFGVWIEQFAASLPAKPVIKDSLDGGTDYAYGFATTGKGTGLFTFGPSDVYSVNVNNIGQQIIDYLATHPKITSKTLFVVWGGANDLLQATSQDDIIDAGINQSLNIQRLVDAGATQFIVPNLPPLGSIPRLNGSAATSVPATEAAALYNEVLALGVGLIRDFNFRRHLQIAELDTFSLFNQIIAAPATYSFANVTASSQGEPVDPDTYLFWDDLHPTTHGHNILATTAARLLTHAAAAGKALCAAAEPCAVSK